MRATQATGIFLLLAAVLATTIAAADPVTAYGDELELEQAVSVAELLAEPDPYVGKRVRVEGKITDVCPRMGCWIDIEDGCHQTFATGICADLEAEEGYAIVNAYALAFGRAHVLGDDSAEVVGVLDGSVTVSERVTMQQGSD